MSTYPHDEDEGPAGEEDEVAYEEAGDPDDGEAHAQRSGMNFDLYRNEG